MTDGDIRGIEDEWSLDEVAVAVAQGACRKAGLDEERWTRAVLARRGWGTPKLTLDALGAEYGLTRERIRQVAKQAEAALPLSVPELPLAMVEVAEAFEWSESADGFRLLFSDGDVDGTPEQWSPERYLDLLRACGRTELADELARRAAEGRLRRQVPPELKKAIRQARSGLGVLDLRTVSFQGTLLHPDDVYRAVQTIYARTARVDDWAFVAGAKATSLENTAIVQLMVAGELTGQELANGISRQARNRAWVMPPSHTAIELLREINCIAKGDDGYVPGPAHTPVEVTGIERWLLDTLRQTPLGAIGADELKRLAREAGVNEATIGVYMTYTPFVRRDRGIIRLVGEELAPEDLDMLIDVQRAQRVDGGVQAHGHPAGVELDLTLGTVMLQSGVISINKAIRTLIGGRRHRLTCCPDWDSQARLGESQNGVTWYGWAPLFQHWLEAHGVEEGQTVRVLMDTEKIRCLEPWAQASSAAPTQSPAPMLAGTTEPSTAPDSRADVPTPGDPWPRPRGSRVLTLSARFADFVVPGGSRNDRTLLSAAFGEEAEELARQWLAIRPSGGRVFIDRDGNASTLIDDRLIYLGALPPHWRW